MRMLLSDAAWGATWSKARAMTPWEFFLAFASHRSVAVYSGLAAIAAAAAIDLATSWQQLLLPPLMVAAIYPMVEFLVHRYVLHSQLFYKQPQTAAFWRRVHYDHHMNPNDLSVLFGALYTTLPLVFGLTLPLGWATLGAAGACATAAAGLIAFLIYEFFHCAAHLPVRFPFAFMQRLRRHHALHHFHAEKGNYGIATGIADRILGTNYDAAEAMPRSATVNNLGYTDEVARRYPWVAMLDRDLKTP
jgi:sterol desaturase/sphingolipid hydroxylase (fatty acid hydroxylase superfamily)